MFVFCKATNFEKITMDSCLQELRNFNSAQNTTRLKDTLRKILARALDIELVVGDDFEALLYQEDDELLLLTIQCIAELSKQEHNRKIFTTKNIIVPLINLSKKQDNDQVLQCFRALGNISYENDEARIIIGTNGIQILISKVTELANKWLHKKESNLMSVLCGCLLNILMSNDDLQKTALNSNVISIIETVLKKTFDDFQNQQDCITYVLQILNFICDHMIDQWLSEELCCLLVNIVRLSENPEISVLCLEILRQQSENDDIKFCLAKLGTCELVYELVQKYGNRVDDEDSRSALKLACDLIVLILTGDESMNLLYDNSHGKVYNQMISWMDSDDIDLVTTGVLAIGNFARNDMHCIYMVQSGLSKKLIDMLAKYNNNESDTKLQHAILSTLRHLSIPAQNKALLIEENIIDVMYSMIDFEYYPVIFKLMGTFRMLVDEQETTARALINRKEFIEKIVYWCYNSDHLGVRAEAPRLLVWLIKNSHSFESFPMILSIPDSLKCLVEMISSSHAMMQNEALLALNLICLCHFRNNDKSRTNINDEIKNLNIDNNASNVDGVDVAESFVDAKVGENIAFIVNKYYDKVSFETAKNLINLLLLLSKSTKIVDHLKACNIKEVLILLQRNKNVENLSSDICSIISLLESEVKV